MSSRARPDEPLGIPPQRWVIRPGDSLPRLAERFYGDDTRWPKIFEANRDRLESPNELPEGLEILIPA